MSSSVVSGKHCISCMLSAVYSLNIEHATKRMTRGLLMALCTLNRAQRYSDTLNNMKFCQ